jgi:hypothetical protein
MGEPLGAAIIGHGRINVRETGFSINQNVVPSFVFRRSKRLAIFPSGRGEWVSRRERQLPVTDENLSVEKKVYKLPKLIADPGTPAAPSGWR